jgi:hypothetical protein
LPSRNRARTGNSYDEEKDGKGSKSEEAHQRIGLWALQVLAEQISIRAREMGWKGVALLPLMTIPRAM